MGYILVKKVEASLRQIAPNKSALNYITKDISPNISFATTKGENYFEEEVTDYDRIYYVSKGKMVLNIDGELIEMEEGDACLINKGTKYSMEGTFEAVVVNQPAFGT